MESIFHTSNPVYLADTSLAQSSSQLVNPKTAISVGAATQSKQPDSLLQHGGVSVAVILGVTIFTGILLDKVIQLVKVMK
jgi:hypothetical protein